MQFGIMVENFLEEFSTSKWLKKNPKNCFPLSTLLMYLCISCLKPKNCFYYGLYGHPMIAFSRVK